MMENEVRKNGERFGWHSRTNERNNREPFFGAVVFLFLPSSLSLGVRFMSQVGFERQIRKKGSTGMGMVQVVGQYDRAMWMKWSKR
jgi:hypothetical protein